ncbi:MAG: RIP metalloprotease RseP, partial [Burkholderiales bacterium]
MSLLNTILAFVVALGVLIVIHEFGHYLVARLCDVKVLRFSLGFGRPLFIKRMAKDGTEWVVAAFPIGGYVKMLDEREGEVAAEDLPRAFNSKTVLQRFLIVVAGPVANLLLAIVLYWVLFMAGVPGIKPILGEIAAGTAAAQAGFQPGMRIVAVAGGAVATWQDARWMLLKQTVGQPSVLIEAQLPGAGISRH